MADPVKMTIDSAVEIDGREDARQLVVQGHVTQTEPLQTWEDHAGGKVAELEVDGHLQIGDLELVVPGSVPGTPATNRLRVYPKSDGKLYAKNWNGVEYDLTGAGGSLDVSKETVVVGEVVHEVTLAAAGTFDTGTIDLSDYDWVVIRGLMRSTHNTFDDTKIYFNGDTTDTNYRAQLRGDNIFDVDFPLLSAAAHAASPADYFGTLEAFLPAPGGDQYKILHANSGARADATAIYEESTVVHWENDAAITRIQVVPRYTTNLAAGSWLQIVGYKALDVVTDVQGGGGGGSADDEFLAWMGLFL
jgi:hypothetical protein